MARVSFFTITITYALTALVSAIDYVVRTAMTFVQKIADIEPEQFAAELQAARNWLVPRASGSVSVGFGSGEGSARDHVSMLNCIGQRSCAA